MRCCEGKFQAKIGSRPVDNRSETGSTSACSYMYLPALAARLAIGQAEGKQEPAAEGTDWRIPDRAKAPASGRIEVDIAVAITVDVELDTQIDRGYAECNEGIEAAEQLPAGDGDVLTIAKESPIAGTRSLAIDLEIVFAGFKFLILAGCLAVHVGLGRARTTATFDAMLDAAAVDHRTLDIAFAIAGCLARGHALNGVFGSSTARVTRTDAFAEAIVLADDIDSEVATFEAGLRAATGAHRIRQNGALFPAHGVELGGTAFLVDTQFVAAGVAVNVSLELAAASGLETDACALRDPGLGKPRRESCGSEDSR